jgi:hypothetical protein
VAWDLPGAESLGRIEAPGVRDLDPDLVDGALQARGALRKLGLREAFFAA